MTNEKNAVLRRIEARRWIALGTVAAVGLAAAGPVHAAPSNPKPAAHASHAPLLLAATTEGGEGGEAGAARAGDAEFLAALGYIKGHLRVGIALYEAGEASMAKTHMRHPGDEIYEGLRPGLAERGADGFEDELAALAAAVEGGASVADAKEAFDEVLHEIDEAREHTGGGEAAQLVSVALITREAAGDYEAAIADGKFVDIHEYQDAWGFIEAARAMAAELTGSARPEVAAALAKINAQFEVIAPAFPGLVPGADMQPADPSVIYGAAARMELAALSVK